MELLKIDLQVGGIRENTVPMKESVSESESSLEILSFPVAPLGCNCSILRCKESNEAIVIDPGGEAEKITQILAEKNCKVLYVIHTHAHFDHILGTDGVAQFCTDNHFSGMENQKDAGASLKIGLHKGDLFLYDSLAEQCRYFGLPAKRAETPINHWIEDNEELRFGRHKLEILHTPGHTPGSCSFHLPEAGILFSGDTLFARSIGRTDLPGGDSALILKSIRERLFRLDDATAVVPGHGEFTRIFEEKRENPFF